MSSAQDRIIVAALLLAESAWLSGVVGAVGLAFGGAESPLGWLAVLAVLSASYLVARALQALAVPATTAYGTQMVAGVVVIYLTVGSQLFTGPRGFDLYWVAKLIGGAGEQDYALRAILGSIMGAGLWWRGGHICTTDTPIETLETSFKAGIMVLAVAAIVDIFHSADLHVFPLMFLFFASSLVGLSVGHMLPPSRKSVKEKAWPRVIGAVVSGVIVLGLMFSLLQRSSVEWLAEVLGIVLRGAATVVFYLVIVPLALLIDFIVRIFFNILSRFASGEEPEVVEPPAMGEMFQDLQRGAVEEPVASALLQALEWTLIAVIVIVALFFLARAFQRRLGWRRQDTDGEREPIMEDIDPAGDLAKLLLGLIPSRFRSREARRAFRLPDDEAGIVDVFRIYLGMLAFAEDKGMPRPPDQTPLEYQDTLRQIFPADLVGNATHAFVRACYGHHPASPQQIADMRAAFEQASANGA